MDKIISTDQLINCCKALHWARKVTQLHIHHTWSPSHKDYNGSNGLDLQQAMRNYHVKNEGWKDIGQHLTLLPDGQWITGRDFNLDPASIAGWNAGAFAIEMLGNFDAGNDKFEGKQAESMFKFCAWVCMFVPLNIDSDVKFHRDNPTAGKTCPGTGIDRMWFMNTLKDYTKTFDKMAWKDILNKVTSKPDEWEKAIETAVNAAKSNGNLGDLEIFQYLPTLIEKIYNSKGV